MKISRIITVFLFILIGLVIRFPFFGSDLVAQKNLNYETLHELFFEWRKFETPPLLNGAEVSKQMLIMAFSLYIPSF